MAAKVSLLSLTLYFAQTYYLSRIIKSTQSELHGARCWYVGCSFFSQTKDEVFQERYNLRSDGPGIHILRLGFRRPIVIAALEDFHLTRLEISKQV